jgi:Cof subfamily protein (haloacid dehalogenase superfamily)
VNSGLQYRLLAADVDGTLLRSDGTLSPAVADAVKAAAKGGLEVVLCSGRRFRKILPIVGALELRSPVVVNSGTLVKDPTTGENLLAEYLDQDLAERIVADLCLRKVAVTVHVDSPLDDIDFLVPCTQNAPDFFARYLDLNQEVWQPGLPTGHRLRDRITVVCAAGDPEELKRLGGELAHRYDGAFNWHVVGNVRYVGDFLEIYSPEASKWKAAERIARKRGIGPGEIAAVGDDENDLEMIREAGLGAAVANAAQCVRAAASMVIPSNDDDGIVRLIEEIVPGLR